MTDEEKIKRAILMLNPLPCCCMIGVDGSLEHDGWSGVLYVYKPYLRRGIKYAIVAPCKRHLSVYNGVLNDYNTWKVLDKIPEELLDE